MNLIYGLVDPNTLLVRYVGKSTSGLRRPREHGLPCRANGTTHVARWVQRLAAAGQTYAIVVLEDCAGKDMLFAIERWWIAFGRACGWPLTNLTDGGEGTLGWEVNAVTRKRIGDANRGRRPTAEHRAKISAAMKTRVFTADHKRRLSEAARNASPEHKAKNSAALKGRVFSAEHRAKLSVARRRR